ncbi:uncharacterized protein LOC142552371 isoform X2 [Primulina tabacum]|uniref:uncharacterized protein LOC142552371 isoform X2 n=1 Tax=Primulina tabacum TaxID=48773 RepID=UPI003F592768
MLPEDKEDDKIDAVANAIYPSGVENGRVPMKENWDEQMANDDSELGFCLPLRNIGDGDEAEGLGLGLRVTDATGREDNDRLHLDGDIGERGEDFFKWVNDMGLRYTASGGSGSQVDVNMKLGFNGEPPSSSSSAVDVERNMIAICQINGQNFIFCSVRPLSLSLHVCLCLCLCLCFQY